MIATDREWLRFTTFGVVAGGIVGASYTGALVVRGHAPPWAIAGGAIATGVLAILAHIALRYSIDFATDPSRTETPTDDTDTEADA